MTLASILVVDSDSSARDRVIAGLRDLGHDVSATRDAESALRQARLRRPDLMLCDFSLPDLAGVDLLADVRGNEDLRTMRIVMTSDRAQPDHVVEAFESGADDYIAKPIDMVELGARVAACLRRPANVAALDQIDAGGIVIDSRSQRVAVDGSYVSLAPREYRLLQFLLANQDRVFSRKQLLVHVWDRDKSVGARTVDVHIRRLRSILEPFGYEAYLQTVRGSGYRFSLET